MKSKYARENEIIALFRWKYGLFSMWIQNKISCALRMLWPYLLIQIYICRYAMHKRKQSAQGWKVIYKKRSCLQWIRSRKCVVNNVTMCRWINVSYKFLKWNICIIILSRKSNRKERRICCHRVQLKDCWLLSDSDTLITLRTWFV